MILLLRREESANPPLHGWSVVERVMNNRAADEEIKRLGAGEYLSVDEVEPRRTRKILARVTLDDGRPRAANEPVAVTMGGKREQ